MKRDVLYRLLAHRGQWRVASSISPRQYPSSSHGLIMAKSSHATKTTASDSRWKLRIRIGSGISPTITARTVQSLGPRAWASHLRSASGSLPHAISAPRVHQYTTSTGTQAHSLSHMTAMRAARCPNPSTKSGDNISKRLFTADSPVPLR